MATVKSDIKEIKAMLADINDGAMHKAKLYDQQKERLQNTISIILNILRANILYLR